MVILLVLGVLKVLAVLIYKVPDHIRYVVLTPLKPVFYARFYIKHSPPVKFGRVHVPDLILGTMLATINGSEDKGFLV